MLSFFVLLLSFKSIASPHPLAGSSIINQASNSIVFSQMGFRLDAIPANWIYKKAINTKTVSLELGTENKTLLSFILESVSVKTQLEPYVRQYLRDYNQYGFEVTSIQSHSKSYVPSVIVDLNRKNKTAKSRQVFYFKDNKMIIATCADETAEFEKTIAICNQVLSSFKWR
ncbi:MAG: hypothetical protein ABL930_13805 [Pseudobdellovibrio sp.]